MYINIYYSIIIMIFTEEQLNYINYTENNNTKLIACAGSGKTRCIIEKMNKLIKINKFNKGNIIMLTFSKFTRDDFIHKVKENPSRKQV
jgi:superfamily I DNA/RNA helicase